MSLQALELGQLRGIVGKVEKGFGSITSTVVTSNGCNIQVRGGYNELGLLVSRGERVSFYAVGEGIGFFSEFSCK